MDEIRFWYDGYRFGNKEIYNPWSVTNYFASGCQAKPYWANTSDNEIICEILTGLTPEIADDLAKVMQGEEIQASPDRKLTITPETEYCYGKGEWLYVNIELTDASGILVTDEDCRLSVSVEGGADRMGFCSAHPAPAYGFNEGITRMHKGRAVLVLKRNQTEKEIRIHLEADHELVKEAATILTCPEPLPDIMHIK